MADHGDTKHLQHGYARILTTSGATYLIDTVKMTLTRTRPLATPTDGLAVGQLRRDGEELKILDIRSLEAGERGVFIIEPLGHPELTNATVRSTTPIVSVEWIAPDAVLGSASD